MLRILATEDETTDHTPLPDTEGSRERMLRDSGKESGQGILGLSVVEEEEEPDEQAGEGQEVRPGHRPSDHLVELENWA